MLLMLSISECPFFGTDGTVGCPYCHYDHKMKIIKGRNVKLGGHWMSQPHNNKIKEKVSLTTRRDTAIIQFS